MTKLESLKTLYYEKRVHPEATNAISKIIPKRIDGVASLSFMVMNDNTVKPQIDTQIRKNVVINIIMLVLYCCY